ncbi:MAG: DUF4209 domain-containing protein [Flavobacteriales bacterium]|nr:DUF4209 domain-containing protein [Flavobacteriales bacterium]
MPPKLYDGELAWFDQVDLNVDLKEIPPLKIWEVVAALSKLMREAASVGRLPQEAVYRFLHALCSFQPAYKPGTESFEPLYIGENGETLFPEAIGQDDAKAIAYLIKRLDRLELKTRLLDLHWLATKERTSIDQAVDGYIGISDLQNEADNSFDANRALKRALQLAIPRGRKSALYTTARSALMRTAKEYLDTDNVFGYKQCADLILEHRLTPPAELLEPLERLAELEWEKKKGIYAEAVYQTAISAARRAGNLEFEHMAFRRIGEMKVMTAAMRCEGPSGSYMAAGMILKEAIQALQKGRADHKRIDELKGVLTDYQTRGGAELKPYSFEIDIEEPVKASRDWIKGQPFGLALRRLSGIRKLTDLPALRQQVQDSTEKKGWDQFFTTLVLDANGRHRQIRHGYSDLNPEDKEKAMESLMFSEALFEWKMRVQAFIEPARAQFTDEHNPSLQLLIPIVLYSNFVPESHANTLLRGLHAGFHGDWVLASYLIVPQLEASIRHCITVHGGDVTSIKEDGTQQNKTFRDLLLLPEAIKLFGNEMCFELRGLLVEESGWNYRNRLAHGMLDDAQNIGVPAILTWWLALKLCVDNLELPQQPTENSDIEPE